MNDLYYLASPYSHTNPEIREKRYREAMTAAVFLLNANISVFSPIAYNHAMIKEGHSLPIDWDFWRTHDLSFLAKCHGIIILTLADWDRSTGVRAEIEFARQNNKKIVYASLEDVLQGKILL